MSYLNRLNVFLLALTILVANTLISCEGGGGSSIKPKVSEEASANTCPGGQAFVNYAQKNFCKSGSNEKIFVLIDGSDGFSGGSREWIKENIFNQDTLSWESEGAKIGIALLSNKPVADLDYFNICAPKHESKISYIWDAPAKVKRDNEALRCAVTEAADNFLDYSAGADKSLLIESVAEVFKNPRYKFQPSKSNQGSRKFIFVSDLFQNSNPISFFKLCRKKPGNDFLTCPSYKELIGKNEKSARYLTAAMPNLNERDEVYIFNINIDNRIDQSAREFWEQYFIAAGATADNVHYRVELDR